MIFSSTYKIYSTVSGRRFATDLREAKQRGYLSHLPHYNMIKSKFGQRLRSRTLTAQINEALCKVLCHNVCVVIQSMHELNITPEFSNAA